MFFILISPIFEKKCDKSKLSWLALLFNYFLIKIQPNMSEQEKKRQRSYDLLDTENKSKKISELIRVFFIASIKPKP